MTNDYQAATAALLNPDTSAIDLTEIAKNHPALHMGVAMHPTANNEVFDYLIENGDPSVGKIVESRMARLGLGVPADNSTEIDEEAQIFAESIMPMADAAPALVEPVKALETGVCANGHIMAPDERFCTECGSRAVASSEPPAPDSSAAPATAVNVTIAVPTRVVGPAKLFRNIPVKLLRGDTDGAIAEGKSSITTGMAMMIFSVVAFLAGLASAFAFGDFMLTGVIVFAAYMLRTVTVFWTLRVRKVGTFADALRIVATPATAHAWLAALALVLSLLPGATVLVFVAPLFAFFQIVSEIIMYLAVTRELDSDKSIIVPFGLLSVAYGMLLYIPLSLYFAFVFARIMENMVDNMFGGLLGSLF